MEAQLFNEIIEVELLPVMIINIIRIQYKIRESAIVAPNEKQGIQS